MKNEQLNEETFKEIEDDNVEEIEYEGIEELTEDEEEIEYEDIEELTENEKEETTGGVFGRHCHIGNAQFKCQCGKNFLSARGVLNHLKKNKTNISAHTRIKVYRQKKKRKK